MSRANQATIYTTQLCAYCQAAKDFLSGHNVSFKEIQVDADPAAAEEMIARSGQMGVPFTVISNDEGATEVEIVGFDQPRLEKALGI